MLAGIAAILCGQTACQRDEAATPPPDARRPVLKSEAELAAERQARIDAGEVVPTESPAIQAADQQRLPPRRVAAPIKPTPGAIEADILLVNDAVLTANEVLFPIWGELTELRRAQTLAGFREGARELIRREVRREIGSLLVYAEAMRELADEQTARLGFAVDKQVEDIVAREGL